MPKFLGRKPRAYNPRVPHMSALLAGKKMPPIPDSIHYASHMPANFGMMLNDTLGCCTCAAYYHARQVWTFNSATAEDTSPDTDVLALYEGACGYRPDNPTTDEGGVEQNVLGYLLNSGAPLAGGQVDKILAFVEVDPRNVEDVKRTIFDCGVAYIGFNVPESIVPPNGDTPAVWAVDPRHSANQGGHAVVLCGYDGDGADVISWGRQYSCFTTDRLLPVEAAIVLWLMAARTGHGGIGKAIERCVGGGAGLRRAVQVGAGDRDVERRRAAVSLAIDR